MKEWKSPKLTALVRSNPEEAVLSGCKMVEAGGMSAIQAGNCIEYTDACNIPCNIDTNS